MDEQQLCCTECAGRFKLAIQAEFKGAQPTPNQMQQFSDTHPLNAPLTMANGMLFCLEHLPVASQAQQLLTRG